MPRVAVVPVCGRGDGPAGSGAAVEKAPAQDKAAGSDSGTPAPPQPPREHPAQKRWPIIRDYIEREGIARQHIDSYDWFVARGMQAVVDDMGSIEVDHPDGAYTIRLGQVDMLEPRISELDRSVTAITPREARLRGATYRAPVRVEISVEGHDGMFGPWKKMHIGDIPVMLRSGPCVLHGMDHAGLVDAGEDPDDPGGYFVVNGSERAVVAQEDLSHNRILLEHDPGTKGAGGGGVPRPRYIARVYSATPGYRTRIEVVLHGDSPVVVRTGASPVDLPAIVLMRAMGMESNAAIADAITTDEGLLDALEYSFDQAERDGGKTARTAREYIASRVAPGMAPERRDRSVSFILDVALLPHVGRSPDNRLEKATLIGEAVSRIVELKAGRSVEDDRDNYGNKTVRFAGDLLADVFRSAVRAQARDAAAKLAKPSAKRTFGAVGAALNTNMLTDRMGNAVSTGNWTGGRSGVSQVLDRLNHLATISHLRRIASPLSKTGENILARDVHSSYFGRLCPCETPEGAGCGLIKSLALEAVVSRAVPVSDVMDAVRRAKVMVARPDEASHEARDGATRVFCDGRLVGFVEDGRRLAMSLREQRRSGRLHPHTGIALHQPSAKAVPRLYLSCNAGRLLRPLLVLEDKKGEDGTGDKGASMRTVMTDRMLAEIEARHTPWSYLLSCGALELIDAHEEDELYVAVDETGGLEGDRTHMEVWPPAMLSAIASIIPYPEHNQSPRNTYESAMAKQSLGFSTPLVRLSTSARQHMMLYPQAPIVRTRAMELIGIDDRPAGVNCVVAVLPFDGFNIEDSVVLSKQSVERGLARSIFYRTYAEKAKRYDGGLRDVFERPDPSMPPRGYSGERHYTKLDSTGSAAVGAEIGPGDMVIGRTGPPRFMADSERGAVQAGAAKAGGRDSPGLGPAARRDKSVRARPGERGTVDTVLLSQAADGTRMLKVRVAEMRSPEIGDKFAARHGQKGVCGILARGEDLPYSADGIVPDLLINPHAFPSRMTIGMFVELIGGKAAAVRGSKFDASAFVGEKVGNVRAALEAAGYSYTGRQTMYDGRTGLPFKCETFVGVVFYQRLQHMATDKLHGRSRGPKQMLTGQPTHGKARGGGLRFGEMERDCMVAYGASAILRDRMFDSSDKTEVRVCERCGQVAYYDVADGSEKCTVCGPRARVSRVRMGRAFKLLLQEVQALGITMRMALRFGG